MIGRIADVSWPTCSLTATNENCPGHVFVDDAPAVSGETK